MKIIDKNTIDTSKLKPLKFDWITESGYYLYWEKDTDQPRVFSNRTFKSRLIFKELTFSKRSSYLSVKIYRNLEPKTLRLHRLVQLVKTWDIDKFNNFKLNFVNHIDWNKLNNSPINLEWSNPKHNAQHSLVNWLMKFKKWEDNWQSKEYICYHNGIPIKEFKKKSDLQDFLKVCEDRFYKMLNKGTITNWFSIKFKYHKIIPIIWEIWKPLKLTSKKTRIVKYYWSSLWRIKSININSGFEKILSMQSKNNLYSKVEIYSKRILVHKIIAELFIWKPPTENHIVNHKDWNKLNNKIDNLEYCTQSENVKHAYTTWLNKSIRAINQYWLDWKFIKTFSSIAEASKVLNIKPFSLGIICRWSNTSAGGFIFRYYEWNTLDIDCFTNCKKRKVSQYDLSWKYLRSFDSVAEATKQLKVKSDTTISLICLWKRRQTKGFMFKYDNWNYSDITPLIEQSWYYDNYSKPINQYDLTGKYIKTFKSIIEVTNILNIKWPWICNACSGAIKSAWNYMFRYDKWDYSDIPKYKNNKCKEIHMFDLKWNFLQMFKTIAEASNKLKLNATKICFVCSWKQKSIWWFIFKYA
jgi:hypothetical protein